MVPIFIRGEELTLPEVRDIPENRLTDPRWKMSGYKDRGRDGCRVPIPWKTSPNGAFGFSAKDSLTPEEAGCRPVLGGEVTLQNHKSMIPIQL